VPPLRIKERTVIRQNNRKLKTIGVPSPDRMRIRRM